MQEFREEALGEDVDHSGEMMNSKFFLQNTIEKPKDLNCCCCCLFVFFLQV